MKKLECPVCGKRLNEWQSRSIDHLVRCGVIIKRSIERGAYEYRCPCGKIFYGKLGFIQRFRYVNDGHLSDHLLLNGLEI